MVNLREADRWGVVGNLVVTTQQGAHFSCLGYVYVNVLFMYMYTHTFQSKSVG